MKKENKKKLILVKIKIASLSNPRQYLPVTNVPTEGPTCAVCDPMTITETGMI